jgi:hypothetical protein
VAALTGHLHPIPPPSGLPATAAALPALVVARAYASGITAVTGVEAISNGVSVFRPVEWRNARRVLTWMGAILAVSFTGITLLAWRLRPVPTERRTLVSELGAALFGRTAGGRAALLILQVTTTAILVLAANTSFSDFPRLASFHAADGYLPRPFLRRGPRLVFSVGIVTLAVLAMTVTIVLGADVHRMIPLYAVGVFASFTFSQAGMTRRHLRLRQKGWRTGLLINGVGVLGSGSALVAILVTKFTHGAWVVALLIPAGVGFTLCVRRYYDHVDGWLAQPHTGHADWRRHVCVVAVGAADGMARRGLELARRLQPDELHAVHVEVDPEETKRVVARWQAMDLGVDLEVVPAPYRERGGPLLAAVRQSRQAGATMVTVVICRLVVRWWQRPLLSDDTAAVRAALLGEPGVAVIENELAFRAGDRRAGRPAPTAPSADSSHRDR